MIRFPGRRTAYRAARWLKRLVDPCALILMYHRVATLPSDPFQLAVSPDHFAEHMEVLWREYRPTALKSLVNGRSWIPRRCVVVTFDDGYQDNLVHAKPRMAAHEIPGTVFVSPGYVDSGREFWWDELERLILTPGKLPQRISIAVNGRTFEWNLKSGAEYTDADYETHRGWDGACPVKPNPRQELFLALHQLLRPLPETEQRRVLDQLDQWTGLTRTRESHQTLSSDELGELDEGNLIEIGAHTMTHPVLAAHPSAVQKEEILKSKKSLESELGHPVDSFAYPYGTRDDYTHETVGILRELGFASACTTTPGLNARDCDPFQLRRVVVRDWDGDRFARMLREQFSA